MLEENVYSLTIKWKFCYDYFGCKQVAVVTAISPEHAIYSLSGIVWKVERKLEKDFFAFKVNVAPFAVAVRHNFYFKVECSPFLVCCSVFFKF